MWLAVTDDEADREEALRDDFQLDSSAYYDEDEDWDDDGAQWEEGDAAEGEHSESKDESTAYLDFLNEEVRQCLRKVLIQMYRTNEIIPGTKVAVRRG